MYMILAVVCYNTLMEKVDGEVVMGLWQMLMCNIQSKVIVCCIVVLFIFEKHAFKNFY